ncbi:exported hypothetical protein [Thiomonas sp. CB3]|nr:exported hypothetical protein [Thiomonas sp. CB3]
MMTLWARAAKKLEANHEARSNASTHAMTSMFACSFPRPLRHRPGECVEKRNTSNLTEHRMKTQGFAKKSLIALAVVGAFSGSAFAADSVQLYGIIDMGIGHFTGIAPSNTTAAPGSTASYTGLIGRRYFRLLHRRRFHGPHHPGWPARQLRHRANGPLLHQHVYQRDQLRSVPGWFHRRVFQLQPWGFWI